jgi:hypothetical protein
MNNVKMLKDFVEGRIDVIMFMEIFRKMTGLQEYLKDYRYNLTEWLLGKNINTISGQCGIWVEVDRFLKYKGIEVAKPNLYYCNRFDLLLDIQPQFLYSSDSKIEDYLEREVINKIPAEIKSKTQKIKWCKEKIKEHFRWKTKQPYWLQNCEWPFNGKGEPMVFQYQKKKKEGDFLKYLYYFKDIETGEVVEVEQYD